MTTAEIFFGPGDWIATATSARERRAIATWLLILALVTLPFRYFWKDTIWLVWALSEAALVISLLTVAAAETPVEEEHA